MYSLRSNEPLAPISPALLKYVALYGGYVALLHAVDGPWRDWKTQDAAVDPWTATHVFWGALGSYMGLGPSQVILLASVNEMVEHVIRKKRPDLLWGTPESGANVFLDLVSTLAGWKLAEVLAK